MEKKKPNAFLDDPGTNDTASGKKKTEIEKKKKSDQPGASVAPSHTKVLVG